MQGGDYLLRITKIEALLSYSIVHKELLANKTVLIHPFCDAVVWKSHVTAAASLLYGPIVSRGFSGRKQESNRFRSRYYRAESLVR